MTISRLMLAAALGALVLGIMGLVPARAEAATLFDKHILLAANDAPPADADTGAGGSQDSAKMGEGPGTHTGDDQGATPENDTQKVDQPPRRNETTTDPSGDQGDAGK